MLSHIRKALVLFQKYVNIKGMKARVIYKIGLILSEKYTNTKEIEDRKHVVITQYRKFGQACTMSTTRLFDSFPPLT